MSKLHAGAAKVDVTPETPCQMQGYANRLAEGIMNEGVYDRLHVRTVMFESGGRRVSLTSCDLCVLDPQTVTDVRGLVCEPLGMAPEDVMIVTTHTHAGPFTYFRASNKYQADREWIQGVAHKIAESILLADRRLQPAKIGITRGESHIAGNRMQVYPDGVVWLGRATEKPIDSEIILERIDTADGKPIARLVNYGCHATVLGPKNRILSGDFPGQSMTALEEKAGDGTVFLFVNGGSGNVNPNYHGLEDPADPRLKELVDEFVADVGKAMRKRPKWQDNGRIASQFRDVGLQRKIRGFEEGLGRLKNCRIQAIQFGDTVVVGSGHEIVHEIAQRMKKESACPNTLVSGYCYNEIGEWHRKRESAHSYLPAREHYEMGGYEVSSSPYGPEAEDQYCDAVVAITKDVYKK